MKLFEIATRYKMLLENSIDRETGEINESAISKLDEINDDAEGKIIATASYIKNIEAERVAIALAIEAMAKREARLNSEIVYLESKLQSNMEYFGISEIKCPYFNVRLKKCPISLDVIDENIIPEKYIKKKISTSIDRIQAKADLLSGLIVPGTALKQNMRLEIK